MRFMFIQKMNEFSLFIDAYVVVFFSTLWGLINIMDDCTYADLFFYEIVRLHSKYRQFSYTKLLRF